jgi:hypothetical protein
MSWEDWKSLLLLIMTAAALSMWVKIRSTEFQFKQIVVQSRPTLYWHGDMPVVCKEVKDK